jgi:hypothetical protein
MIEFNSRTDMIDANIKSGMIGCEIGVFEGEFSEYLLSKKPSMLYLVDPFEGHCFSGNQDGNYGKTVNLAVTYQGLCSRFFNDTNIKLIKDYSGNFLSTLPDAHLDYIYIDGDHSYMGCKIDLELAYQKVKPGGFIMGHDYEINRNKCHTYYDFGVKQAVDEFCAKYKNKIEAKAMDGCVSYLIVR